MEHKNYIPQDERTELTKTDKKVRRVVVAMIIISLLIPKKLCIKDRGTVKYEAILYTVTKHHVMVDVGQKENSVHTFFNNIEIEIGGNKIYENPTYEDFVEECEEKYGGAPNPSLLNYLIDDGQY